jgi:alkylation response protein AidB-like acyl-CoA dehydrogenase
MREHTGGALAAASNLRGLILENRHETESNRQVAEPVIQALVTSGLGRLALPVENGGLSVPPADALAIFETLAEAEASVAWIAWNSSLPCWFARFLAEDVRKEVFGDSDALYACSTRPSGRATKNGDSYTVNGRWSLVSGCMHAAWIPVMCMVEEDGEVQMLAPNAPHMRLLFVPREEHEILDTWHVGGLRGTGSHDSVLKDSSVPEPRSFAMGDPSLMDSPMGRMPIFGTMSAGCAAICLGITKSSLQALLDLGTEKAPIDGGPGLRDRAPVQSLVARVETQLEAMRERLRSTCETLWSSANSDDEISSGDIAALLSTAITTAQQCRAAVTEIYAAAGTSSLYTDSPIERAHRDIHAVLQHIALQPFWLEQAGRVRLGLEPTHPLFRL